MSCFDKSLQDNHQLHPLTLINYALKKNNKEFSSQLMALFNTGAKMHEFEDWKGPAMFISEVIFTVSLSEKALMMSKKNLKCQSV